MDLSEGSVTASLEELARYNMLLTEAIFELLAEKDIISGAEVKARVQKLMAETQINIRRPH